MRLIHVTSQKYPSTKVDPFFWQSMAEAFTRLLGDKFFFLVRGGVPKNLERVHAVSVRAPGRLRTLFYFFSMPIMIFSKGWFRRGTVFFSADVNLLIVLIFWRKVFGFSYAVCSDWHQLFDDWRDTYVSKNSDYLISTSKKLKGLLSSVCGVDPKKILVAYGGVNKEIYDKKLEVGTSEYREKLGLSRENFIVGYVGGFRSVGLEKGLDTMIEALAHLDEKVVMLFVGGSKQHIDEYKVLADRIGVEDRCVFVEKQPFERAVEYKLATDALVIPYPNKHHFRNYGFPLKVWEYMASGRPIVYSNLEIIAEALEGRGTPFKPDDPRSLADAVTSIQKNPESTKKIARENQKDASNYTWDARAKHIINFLQE